MEVGTSVTSQRRRIATQHLAGRFGDVMQGKEPFEKPKLDTKKTYSLTPIGVPHHITFVPFSSFNTTNEPVERAGASCRKSDSITNRPPRCLSSLIVPTSFS